MGVRAFVLGLSQISSFFSCIVYTVKNVPTYCIFNNVLGQYMQTIFFLIMLIKWFCKGVHKSTLKLDSAVEMSPNCHGLNTKHFKFYAINELDHMIM